MDTRQLASQVAEVLLERLRPAYNPGQLDLFSAGNLKALSDANVVEQAPPLLSVRPARPAQVEEDFVPGYGGTCSDD